MRIERHQTERQHNKKFAFSIFLSHEAILLHKETDFSSKKEYWQEKTIQIETVMSLQTFVSIAVFQFKQQNLKSMTIFADEN